MKKYFQAPWSLKDVLNITIIIIVSFILVISLVELINLKAYVEGSKYTSIFISISVFVQGILSLLIIFLYSRFNNKKLTLNDFGLKKIRISKFLMSIFKAYLLYLGVTFIVVILKLYFSIDIPGYGVQEDIIGLFGVTNLDLFIAAITIVIVAPICEELLFRGFFLRSLSNKYGIYIGSFLSAFIFSLLHYPWQSFIPIFILGLILNSIVIKHKTILPAIGFHMFNNGLAFIIHLLIIKEVIALDNII